MQDGLAIERQQLLSDEFWLPLGFRFLHRDESSAPVLLFVSEAGRHFPDCHFLIKSHLKSFLKDLHFMLIILRA